MIDVIVILVALSQPQQLAMGNPQRIETWNWNIEQRAPDIPELSRHDGFIYRGTGYRGQYPTDRPTNGWVP
jgi:hypothetical protein